MHKLNAILAACLLLIPAAFADTIIRNEYLTIESGAAEKGAATFSFITGTTGNPVRASYKMGCDPKYYLAFEGLGANCKAGEYIVGMQCTAAGECKRIWANDFLRASTSEYPPLLTIKNEQWYKDLYAQKPCLVYQCLSATKAADPLPPATTITPAVLPPAPTTAPTKTTTTPTGTTTVTAPALPTVLPQFGDGRFTLIDWPVKANTAQAFHMKGSFKATQTGPMILETYIDPTSKTAFAVVTSTKSACDGSAFYSGTRINAVEGSTYDFDFVVQTPSEEGKYNAVATAWTDCATKGGQLIQRVAVPISITKPLIGGTPSCGDPKNDMDDDTVPDLCDYCPQAYGDPLNHGCHPCYGKDPTTPSGLQCYTTYAAKFGIPPAVKNLINPIVGTSQECKNNAVITYKVRKDGSKEDPQTNDCGSQTCTATGTTAECKAATQAKTPSTEQPTRVGLAYDLCVDGNLDKVVGMSDGSVKTLYKTYEPCNNGCKGAECLPGETCSGGTACSGGTPPVKTGKTECSTDSNCPAEKMCDEQKQCVPKAPSTANCQTDSDCGESKRCSTELGYCVQKAAPTCAANQELYQGQCVPKITITNKTASTETPCYSDQQLTCPNGQIIITAVCVQQKLQPLNNDCSESTAKTGGTTTKTAGATDGTTSGGGWLGSSASLIVGAIAAIAIIFAINKMGKTKRRRTR